jgi:PAS domain S-box-containing protein/diguanylate cyclase (GGDEF)-like protein
MSAARPAEPDLTRTELAQRWVEVVSRTVDPPVPGKEVEQLLGRLINRLVMAVTATPVDEQVTTEVAAELVAHGLTGARSLGRSIEVLADGLPRLAELRDVDRLDAAALRVLAMLASGYAGALRQRALDEQEHVTQALLRAKQDSELELRLCEGRFRAIFSTSAVGIAISTFDGTVLTANRAFAEIVGRAPADLIGTALPELLQAQDDTTLAEAYRKLTSGEQNCFRHRRAVTAASGEVAWTHLGGSLLPDDGRGPSLHLTVVENITELHLLQQELSTQALHDVVTGLPNEQYLMSRLQEVLEKADASTQVTLCRVNLDSYSVITGGIGRSAGESLLRSVAHRLADLLAGQRAMVARLGGDDFAILIEDGPSSPDPRMLAASINETLCEPIYLDGRGLAISAGVGVVRRHASGLPATELLRAAEATLHRAKRSGSGQWALYDAQADAAEQARYQLAAEMPGAWESGEIDVRYEPVCRLDTGLIVALQAVLEWHRVDGTVVNHSGCLALAEQTGLVVPLGRWLVEQACNAHIQVTHCRRERAPLLRLDLTAQLSQDPDLVAVVTGALSATGVRAEQLRVGVPLATLAGGHGDVVDNVAVLADLGLEVVLLGAAAGLGYLAYLEDLPVGAVEIAPEVVTRIAQRPGNDSVVARALRQVIPLARSVGVTVTVPAVDTPEQAQWWRSAGADTARGAHFGQPLRDRELPTLLSHL